MHCIFLGFRSGRKASGRKRLSSTEQWRSPISMVITATLSCLSIPTTIRADTLFIQKTNGKTHFLTNCRLSNIWKKNKKWRKNTQFQKFVFLIKCNFHSVWLQCLNWIFREWNSFTKDTLVIIIASDYYRKIYESNRWLKKHYKNFKLAPRLPGLKIMKRARKKKETKKIAFLYISFDFYFSEREAYVCVMMKQRSENVLEFTTGIYTSDTFDSKSRNKCKRLRIMLHRNR